jgi:hypothetical protein
MLRQDQRGSLWRVNVEKAHFSAFFAELIRIPESSPDYKTARADIWKVKDDGVIIDCTYIDRVAGGNIVPLGPQRRYWYKAVPPSLVGVNLSARFAGSPHPLAAIKAPRVDCPAVPE